jgi:hypothetical protein
MAYRMGEWLPYRASITWCYLISFKSVQVEQEMVRLDFFVSHLPVEQRSMCTTWLYQERQSVPPVVVVRQASVSHCA